MRTSNLSEYDLYLFHQGTNYHAYEMHGAHFIERDGKKGVRFALWAPHARSVSVVGDFNNWDTRVNRMIRLADGETWETFIEGLKQGDIYKYAILPPNSTTHILKDDPYGFWAEKRPLMASKLYNLEGYDWQDKEWGERKKHQSSYTHPMLIYEVHAGSWQRKANNDYLSYRELADKLIAYVKEMNYTHIEFMPLTEHPLDNSCSYQTTGYYAVTSRYGEPNEFRYLVERAHKNNIGVIMDWVDCSNNFDYGRAEVESYLISNALFWLEEFHIDGLRIDCLRNMLYLKSVEEFLKKLNETVYKKKPEALMIAKWTIEPMGFNYKWNMSWMKEMLEYMSLEPKYRKWNEDKITKSIKKAFRENYILALSHEEVVECKRSLIEKMPGDYWEKFAGLRAFFGYWMAHCGKKLLFMGGEFGQLGEWNEEASLDWHLVEEYDMHKRLQKYTRELNKIYLENKSLWQVDFERNGFQWLDGGDSLISFIRKAADSKDYLIVISNFSTKAKEGYRIGVPEEGRYEELINSDGKEYGGRGIRNTTIEAEELAYQNRSHSIRVRIGALSTLYLKRQKEIYPQQQEKTGGSY